MKRLAIFLLALLLLAGCAAEPAVVDLGGKPVTYDSTEEMAKAATLIVTGKVITTDSRVNRIGDQVMSALTISQFEITAVEKGDVQVGEVISIWQNSAYETESNTVYLFCGTGPMTEGEAYLLYLHPRSAGSDYYTPVSPIQAVIPTTC